MLKGKYEDNLKKIEDKVSSDDIVKIDLKIGKSVGALFFIKDLTDKKALGDLVLKPLSQITAEASEKEISQAVLSPEKQQVETVDDCITEIVNGNALLIVDGLKTAFSFTLKNFEKRAIAEPPTSTVIKGPREGFVENLPVNISLLRRKLKTDKLKIEQLMVGKYSNTTIAVCYIKGIADENLVKTVKKKIENISIDAVLDSSYVSKFLSEHKTAIFKQIGNTEKPDILTAKMLEGRIAIIVDGSPIALTIPYLLIEDFQSPSDYYSSSYSATLARLLRLFAVIMSLYLPCFFVSAELFHLQLIPLSFLITIVNSIKGISLSPSYEMFFTLLIFEILNEASVRMPKYVGMVVSIVGGLVLGETAVNAGIISAPTLMIIAFSGICLYTVPELEQTFSVIRLVFLIVGGSLGGYGIIIVTCGLLIYLVSFENYNTPLFAPFSPLIVKDLKDGIYKGFMIEQSIRPLSLKNANNKRINKEK